MSEVTNPIMVPNLCERHLHELVVQRLKLREYEPWRSRVIIAQILLFQFTATDPRFWKRCSLTQDERDNQAMNIVLSEIGCLGCCQPKGFATVWQMMRDDLEGAIAASKRGDWAAKYFAEDPS